MLIQRLTEIYRKESAAKETAAKTKSAQSNGSSQPVSAGASNMPPPVSLQAGGGAGEGSSMLPVAPHPSDQVTPSSHSPREGGSSVEQLRSSLRQVADALAQTVAAVRTTREQLLGGRSSTEEEEGLALATGDVQAGMRHTTATDTIADQDIESRELSSSEVTPFPPLPPPPPSQDPANSGEPSSAVTSAFMRSLFALPSATLTQTTPTTLTSPPSSVLPTFDGSQESAAATLATTDPNDPLHTFLSAIVGGPAPPLATPTTVTTAPSSTQTDSLTATSPRLPVFTQLLQSDSGNTQSHSRTETTPAVPVLQNTGTLDTSTVIPTAADHLATPTTESAADQLATPTTESADQVATPTTESAADHLASQVNLFFCRNPGLEHQEVVDGLVDTGLVDGGRTGLAEELARAMSQLVPSSTSLSGSSSSYASLQPPLSAVGSSAAGGEVFGSGQSPSPSDMLAPLLMASLQMPSSNTNVQSGGQSAESMATGGSGGLVTSAVSSSSSASGAGTSVRMEVGGATDPGPSYDPSIIVTTSAASSFGGSSVGDTDVVARGGEDRSGESTSFETATTPMLTPAMSYQQTTPTLRPPTQPAGNPPASTPTTQTTATTPQATATSSLTSIDPTFLAALPDSIRQEVMAQHEREQRLLRAQREASFMSAISPEFLAALPPNIQEEVSTVGWREDRNYR